MAKKANDLQNTIRNEVAEDCFLYRANTGRGWASNKVESAHPYKITTVTLQPGDKVLRQARPFSTGLPTGFPDTFGWVEHEIKPEDVGKTVAIFLGIEVKAENDRVMPDQELFGQAIKRSGGRAGIAWSVEDAKNIIRGD